MTKHDLRSRILAAALPGLPITPAQLDAFTDPAPEAARSPWNQRHIVSDRVMVLARSCHEPEHLIVLPYTIAAVAAEEAVVRATSRTWGEFLDRLKAVGFDVRAGIAAHLEFADDDAFDEAAYDQVCFDHDVGTGFVPRVQMKRALPRSILTRFADYQPGVWDGLFIAIDAEDGPDVAAALGELGFLAFTDPLLVDATSNHVVDAAAVTARLAWYDDLCRMLMRLRKRPAYRRPAPAPWVTSPRLKRRLAERAPSHRREAMWQLAASGKLDDPEVAELVKFRGGIIDRLLELVPRPGEEGGAN